MNPKKFVMAGSAGFIAERHMRAIKETGNDLVACFDPFDVMGRIDSYFPDAEFFKYLVDFGYYIKNNKIDYLIICSPNNTHIGFCKAGLLYNIDIICEKPLTINEDELNFLKNEEKKSKGKINTILQLRLHPKIIELKKMVDENPDKYFKIDLEYITARGKWYYESWKPGEVDFVEIDYLF